MSDTCYLKAREGHCEAVSHQQDHTVVKGGVGPKCAQYGLLINMLKLYIPLRMRTFTEDLTFQMLKLHPGNSLKLLLFVYLDKFPQNKAQCKDSV